MSLRRKVRCRAEKQHSSVHSLLAHGELNPADATDSIDRTNLEMAATKTQIRAQDFQGLKRNLARDFILFMQHFALACWSPPPWRLLESFAPLSLPGRKASPAAPLCAPRRHSVRKLASRPGTSSDRGGSPRLAVLSHSTTNYRTSSHLFWVFSTCAQNSDDPQPRPGFSETQFTVRRTGCSHWGVLISDLTAQHSK